jgi:hypothetical protein
MFEEFVSQALYLLAAGIVLANVYLGFRTDLS